MPVTSKPQPRTMSEGDTVVITGGNPKYIGLQATLLELSRVPSSARKGYYDYKGLIEIITPPETGTRLNLIQGSFRALSRITPEELQERKELVTKQQERTRARRSARLQGRRDAEAIAKANPAAIVRLKSLAVAKQYNQYETELEALSSYTALGDDRNWATYSSLQSMTIQG